MQGVSLSLYRAGHLQTLPSSRFCFAVKAPVRLYLPNPGHWQNFDNVFFLKTGKGEKYGLVASFILLFLISIEATIGKVRILKWLFKAAELEFLWHLILKRLFNVLGF